MALNHMSELRSSDDRHSDDGSTFSYAAHAWQVGRSERSKDGRAAAATFVVDDDGAVRRDIRGMLEHAGMSVQEFSTSEAFLDVYRPGHRDILLIDANLPGMSGLALLWRLKSSGVMLTSILVTGGREMALGVEAMKAGACDVIQKPFLEKDLLRAVARAQVLAGESDQAASWHEEADRLVAALTPRQLEIMKLVLAGQPSKNIAADLGISQRGAAEQGSGR